MTIPTDGRIDLDALAPCPFCGEPPLVAGSTIWCANGACWGPHMEQYANLDEAIAAWNRRAAIPSEQGEAVAWTRDDLAVGLAQQDNVVLASSKSLAQWDEYRERADDLMAQLSLCYTHPAPAADASNKTSAFQELIDLEQSITECRTFEDFLTVQKTILVGRALS